MDIEQTPHRGAGNVVLSSPSRLLRIRAKCAGIRTTLNLACRLRRDSISGAGGHRSEHEAATTDY